MDDGGWIVVPRWDEFQHRDMARSSVPPWIKTYTRLLHDDAYLGLSAHQRAVLHGLWLMYASHRRQLAANTASITRQLGLRVSSRQLKALVDAGFIEVSASKPASEPASLEVEVEKKSTSTNNGKKPVDKRRRYDELLDAARRFAADWKGGTSDAFDAGLDELERLTSCRLQAGDRYRLWEQAWSMAGTGL